MSLYSTRSVILSQWRERRMGDCSLFEAGVVNRCLRIANFTTGVGIFQTQSPDPGRALARGLAHSLYLYLIIRRWVNVFGQGAWITAGGQATIERGEIVACYVKTCCHPQNTKYITWPRFGLLERTEPRPQVPCLENLVKFRRGF